MIRFLYLFLFAAIPVGCWADEVSPNLPREDKPTNQLLLLRNGQIFEGRITQEDNYHLVRFSNGQVRVRSADVELICRDLAEAYQRKKTVAQGGNLQNHLELAQWCLRQKMDAQAAEELAAAEAIAPGHPLVELFRRKLKTQRPPTAVKPPSAAGVLPSSEELDRLIRGLPPKTVELYTRSVQPLLLNNCTAGGCHGPQSATNFRLLRVPHNQPASRRLTQRNLYAALQYVDRKNPADSPLLKVPAGPHGKLKMPIFNEHQADQYRKIADWVLQFDPSAAPAVVPLAGRKTSKDAAIPVSHEEPLRETIPTPPEKAVPPLLSPPSPTKVHRGAEPPQFIPQDEFDPEIFNRRGVGPSEPPKTS